MAGKRIALVEGFVLNQRLREIFTQSTFIIEQDPLAALTAVSSKKADVYIEGRPMVNYLLGKHFMTDLQVISIKESLDIPAQLTSIATHKDNTVLFGLIQKAINVIPDHQLIKLRSKWFKGAREALPNVSLTREEQDYLDDKTALKINVHESVAPMAFIINQQEQGFTVDLIRYMVQLLDSRIEFIRGTWTQQMQQLQQGAIDVLVDVDNTKERRTIMRFTQPYMQTKRIIVMRNNQAQTEMSLAKLTGKRIAVVKGYATTRYLERQYPDIQLHYVNSELEALLAVAELKVDACIDYTLSVNYLIQKHSINNVQLIPLSEWINHATDTSSFAVRHDNPVLQSILNKALLAVPE